MKVAIVGGHLTPALALIEELKKAGVQIVFFGTKTSTLNSQNLSAEYRQISALKIKFYNLIAGKLQRKFTRHTIPYLLKLPVGFIQAFLYLIIERPNLVVGFGTYLSVPVVFTAWLLGIDSIIHEQASVGGFANKINSLLAKKVFLTWPQTQKYFPKEKSEVVGNLSRKLIFVKTAHDKKVAAFIKSAKNMIFVTGGNQGSHFINKLIFEAQPKLENFQILHQVGTTNFQNDHKVASLIKSSNYLWVDYISSSDIGAIFKAAKFVISRAGANTIWELAILGKCAILIPLSISSGNEQVKNAQILTNAGSSIMLTQETIVKDKFANQILKFTKSLKARQLAADKLKSTLPKNAASIIAHEILST